jgi:hypothetical protein
MFLFRRWYAFAAVGIAATLALEIAAIAPWGGQKFRWREAILAASIGALMLLGLTSPVLVDWLPHPAAHDYATIYAAYRKPTDIFLGLIGDWSVGPFWRSPRSVRRRSSYARKAASPG